MKQKEQIWALSASKTEKVWHVGTIIAENSQLEKEPPYPVRVVVRVKDESAEIELKNGLRMVVKRGHESRVRLWK